MTQGGLFDTPAPRAHERDDKVLFRFTLLSGEVVVGPVHGSGGIIRGGDKTRPLALRRLLGAQEAAADGGRPASPNPNQAACGCTSSITRTVGPTAPSRSPGR
jgi:hypothetical protein